MSDAADQGQRMNAVLERQKAAQLSDGAPSLEARIDRLAIERIGTRRPTGRRVTGKVMFPDVGLRFHDPADGSPSFAVAHEERSEKVASDDLGVASIKRLRQRRTAPLPLVRRSAPIAHGPFDQPRTTMLFESVPSLLGHSSSHEREALWKAPQTRRPPWPPPFSCAELPSCRHARV